MDTASVRSETLQIITIATLIVGFGLFNVSFQLEIGLAGGVLRDFFENPGWPPPEIWSGIVLSFLTAVLGAFIMSRYIGMLLETRRLFARTNLPDEESAERQEIAERQGILLRMLIILAGGTFLLLVFQKLSEVISPL